MVALSCSHGTDAARSGSVTSGTNTISVRYASVYPSVSLNPGRTVRFMVFAAPFKGRPTRRCRAPLQGCLICGSSARPVNPVEHPAVVEVRLLGVLPAAKGPIDREQLDLRERARVFRRHPLVARAVMIPRRDFLPVWGVQELQIGFGHRFRSLSRDDLVDDRYRRLRQNADRRGDDLDFAL